MREIILPFFRVDCQANLCNKEAALFGQLVCLYSLITFVGFLSLSKATKVNSPFIAK